MKGVRHEENFLWNQGKDGQSPRQRGKVNIFLSVWILVSKLWQRVLLDETQV
jgi:hypothetical protein